MNDRDRKIHIGVILVVLVLFGILWFAPMNSTFAATEDAPQSGDEENAPPIQETTPTVIVEDTMTPSPTSEDTPTPTATDIPEPTPVEEATATPTKETAKPSVAPESPSKGQEKPTKSVEKVTITQKPTATSTPSPTPTLHAVVSPAGQKKYKVKASEVTLNVSSTPKFLIDGEEDELWKNSKDYILQNVCWGTDGAIADFKSAWDEQSIYLYIRVKDNTADTDSDIITRTDSVEIYLDETNTKPSEYCDGCQHYYISRNGKMKLGSGSSEDAIDYAVKDTSDGYCIEARIQFEAFVATRDSVIGLDIRVNDSKGFGERDYVIQWSDTSLQTHVNLSSIGSLVLR